ncbi:Sulfite reductase [Globisporangium polare]
MKTSASEIPAVEEAVSHVAYALSDLSYLVKPVPFGRALDKYIVSARRNVFDQVGQLRSSSAGHELLDEAYAASKRGQFVTLFAASPSSLLQMVPTMYKLSAAQLPAVVHVVAREHADLMAVRQTGFVILNALSADETEDMALLAHVASVRANVPFLHVYDGDMVQNDLERRVAQGPHQKFANSLVTYKKLAELIGLKKAGSAAEFRQLVLANSAMKSASNATTDSENASEVSSDADLYFQVSPETVAKYNAVPCVLEQVISEVFAHKQYQLFEYFGHAAAEHVVVVMGTASSVVKDAVESLVANWQAKVGVVSVRLFRPWSTKSFLSVVPATATKIAVLDRMEDITNVGEPLFLDVLGSFQSDEWAGKAIPSIIGGKYAFASQSSQVFDVVTARTLVEQLAANELKNGFTVASSATNSPSEDQLAAKQLVSGYVSSADAFEAPYVKMLLQLFEQRAVIANLVRSTTIWKAQDVVANGNSNSESVPLENGEFGFGVHLGILAKRQQLKDKVASLLCDKTASAGLSQRLVDCLGQWVAKQPKHDDLANEIVILLEQEQQSKKQIVLGEIYALKRFFAPLSQWIIGSEEFSRDVGASGVHQLLASGENVNLLILDTEPIHSVSKTHRKRDLGLYAMQYGNAYVASVALYDSYSQVLRALNEADAFDGPSIILAYAPSCDNMEKDTQEAVSTGYWPLYRYNPLLEGVAGEKAFALESPSIKKDLLAFLQRNNQLSLFAKQALSAPSASTVSLTDKYAQIGQSSLEQSFQALLNGFSNVAEEKWQVDTKLWVLVGSDNGHAEEFASKFVEEATGFGLKNVVKADMNEMTMDALSEEANDINTFVLFVVSTAGQGEFPSNAKEFWTELSGFTSTLPLQYAVFGLGDSLYWPREDEKHYFCKAPFDLDAKLSELGASRLLTVAKADDQDADGPTTQFDAWKPQFWEQVGIPLDVIHAQTGVGKKKQRTNEEIKRESNFLRGTLAVGLEDRSTKALHPDDTQLTKFHGIYQQDDRDLREQMRLEKQEKAFSFMIRVRVPGGVSTAAQYLMIDELADTHANGNIKLTTRQAYQLQGILKWDLKGVVQGINRALMDSLAACGDVNRNVMSTINPSCSVETHEEILEVARELSAHLTPRTSAYHEIWLDKKMVAGGETKDFEPFYGETYLPRKFKIALAIPPSNDVDIFANCLGFIAIIENDKLLGFNVTVGGGMGMTHNNKKTFPRVADLMSFVTVDQVKDVAEKIMILQRDHGDRVNRKHARFKYTVEDHGLDWIRSEVETRLGYKLQPPRPYHFDSNGDRFGWHKLNNGKFCYTMFIEGGRIKDFDDAKIRTGLRELARAFPNVEFHLTGNQNLSVANITNDQIGPVKALLQKYNFGNESYSAMRLNSIACAALPFCGLAFSEAERYLPVLITKIEELLNANGLRDDAIVIRMTGCPNGCGRPYLGEIGFVGRSPGIYNLYLGAGFAGDRLNKLYKEAVDEEQILAELAPIIKDYAENRQSGEKFGDFVIRHGYVKECLSAPGVEKRAPGITFHE